MKHRKMVVYIGLQEFKRHLTTHKFQIGIFGIFKGHRVLQAGPAKRSRQKVHGDVLVQNHHWHPPGQLWPSEDNLAARCPRCPHLVGCHLEA